MDFYFATVLLERNRWTADRLPTYRVSDWTDRISGGGFGGIELWENHAGALSPSELEDLGRRVPKILFNTYADFSDASAGRLEQAAKAISALGAIGCKFNFGNDSEKRSEYIRNFQTWRRNFPDGFRFLCECHAGTLLENPADARTILNELDGPEVQAIVHAMNSPEKLEEWFTALDGRITHCHLNLFRCDGNPWENPGLPGFDLFQSLRMIGASSVNSTSVEFVRGVGEPNEDMDRLFSLAMEDRTHFAGLLSGN